MRILLDSHALLWALHDPERMRRDAVAAIADPAATVFFSAASVWELELKAGTGKLDLPEKWLETPAATGFLELPVTAAEAADSARLPWHHRDPFDRVLVSQASRHQLRIATRDPMISRYGVTVLQV